MRTMKKLTLMTMVLTLVSFSSFGQMTSKNGTPILPEADEWSIGFNAIPVVAFIGNSMYASGGGGAAFTAGNPLTLVGKMVKDENTALRCKLSLNFGSTTTKFLSPDDVAVAADPLSTATVEDVMKVSTMGITVGAGIQKWRGKGRVRGFYGGEGSIGFGNGAGTTTVEYGNAFTATNTTPSWYDFATATPSVGGARPTEMKTGTTIGLTIRGFIGVEYFVGAKTSVSGEFGWGLMFTTTGNGSASTEAINTAGTAGEVTSAETGGAGAFGLGNDVGGGAINLNFYF